MLHYLEVNPDVKTNFNFPDNLNFYIKILIRFINIVI